MVERTKSAARKGSPATKNMSKNASRKMPVKKVSGTGVNFSPKNPRPVRPQNKKQLSKNKKIGIKSCKNSKKLKSPASSIETSKGSKNRSAKASKSVASTQRQSKKQSQVTKSRPNGVKETQISKKPSKLSNRTTSSKPISKIKSTNAVKKSKSNLLISRSKGHGNDVRTPQDDLISRLFSSTSKTKSVEKDTRVAPGTLMSFPSSLISEFQEQAQSPQRPPETSAFNIASSSRRPDSRREEVRRLLLEILSSKGLPSATKSTISKEMQRASTGAQTSNASTLVSKSKRQDKNKQKMTGTVSSNTSTSESREEIRSILMDIITSSGGNSVSRPANPAATQARQSTSSRNRPTKPAPSVSRPANPEAIKKEPPRNRPRKSMPSMKKVIRKSNAVSPARVFNEKDRISEMYNQRIGFDRNLEPSHIVHMAELNGERFFMMKWKGIEMMDMVPVKLAKEKCPQEVIKFYESRLVNVFHSGCM